MAAKKSSLMMGALAWLGGKLLALLLFIAYVLNSILLSLLKELNTTLKRKLFNKE